jgi:peptidoglycan/xylan/chitin deacetylase (PgdA/CDA1 family)
MNGALRQGLIRLCLEGMAVAGVARLIGRFTHGRGAVLMFHRVRPGRPSGFAPNANLEVTPEFLAATVRRVRGKGMEIVTMDEAARRMRTGEGGRFAALTFDDGYRDNLEYAYPVLRALGAPFTVYLATALIDRTGELWWLALERIVEQQQTIAFSFDGPVSYLDCRTVAEKNETFATLKNWLLQLDEDAQRAAIRELAWRYGVDLKAMLEDEMMSWDEVRRLASDPLVTLGAHTVGHYAVARLPAPRARAEMREGARVIEAATGRKPRHFAYPYGWPDAAGPRDFGIAAELGFATAVTTRPGVLTAACAAVPTAWPRVPVNGQYQSIRCLDALLSGVPFAFRRVPQVPGAAAPERLTASASRR